MLRNEDRTSAGRGGVKGTADRPQRSRLARAGAEGDNTGRRPTLRRSRTRSLKGERPTAAGGGGGRAGARIPYRAAHGRRRFRSRQRRREITIGAGAWCQPQAPQRALSGLSSIQQRLSLCLRHRPATTVALGARIPARLAPDGAGQQGEKTTPTARLAWRMGPCDAWLLCVFGADRKDHDAGLVVELPGAIYGQTALGVAKAGGNSASFVCSLP